MKYMPDIIYENIKFNVTFKEFFPPLQLSFWSSDDFLKTYERITGTDAGFIYEVKNSDLTGYMESAAPERVLKSVQDKISVAWIDEQLKNFDAHLENLKKIVEAARDAEYNKADLIKLFETLRQETGNIYPYSNAFYLLSAEVEKNILNTLKRDRSEAEANQLLAKLSRPIKETFLDKYTTATEALAKELLEKTGTVQIDKVGDLYRNDPIFKKKIDELRDEYFCLTSLNGGERTVESLFPDIARKIKLSASQEEIFVPETIKKDLYLLRAALYFKDEPSTFAVPFVRYGLAKHWAAAAAFLNINIVDLDQLLIDEVIACLKETKDVRDLVEERKKATFFFHKPFHSTTIIQGARAEKEMSPLLNQNSLADYGSLSEISGKVGSSGKATGPVKKILHSSEISDFKEGQVLVAVYTAPEFVPAMKKAVAIVTDTGGITCHAAIVSRELKIPCVIGTKIATQVLKDGDIVEVDAEKGLIRIIK